MTISIQDIYRHYLRRQASLAELRDWLALNQWSLSRDDQILADEADVALAHLDDGYGDEDYVRCRLAKALENQTITTTRVTLKGKPN